MEAPLVQLFRFLQHQQAPLTILLMVIIIELSVMMTMPLLGLMQEQVLKVMRKNLMDLLVI